MKITHKITHDKNIYDEFSITSFDSLKFFYVKCDFSTKFFSHLLF